MGIILKNLRCGQTLLRLEVAVSGEGIAVSQRIPVGKGVFAAKGTAAAHIKAAHIKAVGTAADVAKNIINPIDAFQV